MPIYPYRCDSCGVEKDVLQKLSDEPLTVCPECGAAAFHKRLSAPAFQLKGSGWYATDFRDGGKKATAEAGSAAAGKDGKADAAPGGDGKGGGDKGAESNKAEVKATTPGAAPAPAAGSGSGASTGTAGGKPA